MDINMKINQKLRDVKVSQRDLFTSSAFRNYLRDLLSYPCRSIHRRLPPIRIGWDKSEGASVAYTDNKEIYINAASEIMEWAGSKIRKTRIIIGLLVHEYGHIRFTDFASAIRTQKSLQQSVWYPPIPDTASGDVKANEKEVMDYIRSHPKKISLLVKMWHTLHNICEDGYIEECLYYAVSGVLIDSLNYLRRLQWRDAKPLGQMLAREGYDEKDASQVFSVYCSLLLIFMKYGIIKCDSKNQTEMDCAPMTWLDKTMPYAERLFQEPDGRTRCSLVNQMFLTLWPLIHDVAESSISSEEFEEMLQNALGDMTSQDGASDCQSSGSSQGVEGQPSPLTKREKEKESSPASKTQQKTARIVKKMAAKKAKDDGQKGGAKAAGEKEDAAAADDNGQQHGDASDASDKMNPEPGDGKDTDGKGSQSGDGEDADAKGTQSANGDDADGKGSQSGNGEDADGAGSSAAGKDGGEGSNPILSTYDGIPSGQESSSSQEVVHQDLEDSELTPGQEGDDETVEIDEEYDETALAAALRVLEKEVSTQKAVDALNDELNTDLQHELDTTDFGEVHRNMKATIRRVSSVSQNTRDIYAQETKEVQNLAHIMARKVSPYLKKKDDMATMPLTGFFSGQRFDATRLALNDFRNFRMNNTPLPDTRVAVSVVIDESGSMSGSRIQMAQNAALALYLFCEECKIRCSIIGHTAETYERGDMHINVYADFNTPDRDDKYRLMNIKSRNCNRDGAALMFAGTHLLKAEEPVKIMFVISDGRPNADGYSGEPAEKDLSEITAGLRRNGVVVFALAIGDDKDVISRIYGNGFIDISNLDTLPDQLVQLVKRYIR